MPNYDAFGSDEFENAKSAPVSSNWKIVTLDYERLKEETGIEKMRFDPSTEDSEPYVFDFLPFPVTSKHPRYAKLKKAFNGDDPLDWMLTLTFHRINTPVGEFKVLCPNKNFGDPCPFCEKKQGLLNEHDVRDKTSFHNLSSNVKAEIKSLNETDRDFFLVRNHADDKVYVMEYSNFYFGQHLKKKLSRSRRGDSNIILAHPGRNGYSLEFFIEPAEIKDNRGNPIIGPINEMEFVNRKEAIDPDILNNLPALDDYIVRYSYDELEAMLDGTFFAQSGEAKEDEDDTDQYKGLANSVDEDEDVDPEPVPRKKVRKLEPLSEEPDEDEDDAPEPDPEEVRRERRRRRLAKQTETPECPAGGTFGKDTDMYAECEECPVYDKCAEEYEKNEDLSVI